MSGEPTRIEVLAWLDRTGGTVPAAAKQFWPDVTEADRERIISRIKQWKSRSKRAAERPKPPPKLRVVEPGEREPELQREAEPEGPPPDLSSMTPAERATWQLGFLVKLLVRAAKKNNAREVAILNREVSSTGAELDAAKRAEGSTVKMDATPAALALDLVGEDKIIALLAEASALISSEPGEAK